MELDEVLVGPTFGAHADAGLVGELSLHRSVRRSAEQEGEQFPPQPELTQLPELSPGLADAHAHLGLASPAPPDAPPQERVRASALAAGSWAARRFLGLPGLEEGAPADLVAYPDDPRDDPEVLARPALRVLDGRLISSTIK